MILKSFVHESHDEHEEILKLLFSTSCFFVSFVDISLINQTLPFQLRLAAEINQNAYFHSGRLEIIQGLRIFLAGQLIKRFQFDNNFLLTEHISDIFPA